MKKRIYPLLCGAVAAAMLAGCAGIGPEGYSSVAYVSSQEATVTSEYAPDSDLDSEASSSSENLEIFYQWGVLERARETGENAYAGSEPAIIAKHFTISAAELELSVETRRLTEEENAEQLAADTLIEMHSLYYQAQQADVVVSDEYVDQLAKKQAEITAGISQASYDAFLEGLGMTNEEYWERQKESIKVWDSIWNWKELQQEQYMEAYGPEPEIPWEDYYEDLVAEIIRQEQVQFVGSET